MHFSNLFFFFFPCSALDTGTLTENGIDDGTEVRLVPAIESGVTVSCRISRNCTLVWHFHLRGHFKGHEACSLPVMSLWVIHSPRKCVMSQCALIGKNMPCGMRAEPFESFLYP